jgi:hypothetical protein
LEGLIFISVPIYAGVKGNERADMLAGTDVISNSHAMDHINVLHALRQTTRTEGSL